MRNEKIFCKNGSYSFVVESNAVCHREAISVVRERVRVWTSHRNIRRPMRILDLACGGHPLLITDIINCLGNELFEFTGIDINPDQAEQAKNDFSFLSNVTKVRIIEGNAWDLEGLDLEDTYDIIFSGMNFHHGTPEEIYFLATRIHRLIPGEGIFISHDLYRPNDTNYLRRPDYNPNDESESYALLETSQLAKTHIPDFHITESRFDGSASDWRLDYMNQYRSYLLMHGVDRNNVADILSHVYNRDFPVSTDELKRILELIGFNVEIFNFNKTVHPLGKYFAVVAARKM